MIYILLLFLLMLLLLLVVMMMMMVIFVESLTNQGDYDGKGVIFKVREMSRVVIRMGVRAHFSINIRLFDYFEKKWKIPF